jgi:propanol-preferring alcohol dehydrogenase
MRAIVRHRYREWPHLTELPTPTPGGAEVLVRVEASSLNTADLDVALGRPATGAHADPFWSPHCGDSPAGW